jgi:hypothetical protein
MRILWLVSPFGDHTLPEATLEDNTKVDPAHKSKEPLEVMTGVGLGFTVTTKGTEVLEHPLASTTVTVYDPD